MQEINDFITQTVDEVCKHLDIKPSLKVTYEDEAFHVDMEGDNLSFLIGYRGTSLSGLQHFLSLAVHKKFGEWKNIIVDINDYVDAKEEKLEDMAKSYIDRVRFFKEEVHLPPMTPYERKHVHEFVSGYADIETFSIGEGRDRHIVLKPTE